MIATWKRRLRGIVGTALIWGVTLATCATAIAGVAMIAGVVPRSIIGPAQLLAVALRWLVVGGLSGAAFAVAISNAERKRSLSTLSLKRVGVWGFLAMAAVPGLVAVTLGSAALLPAGVLITGSLLLGAIGSAISVGSVRMARRASATTLGDGDELRALEAPE